jgi:hypothetical protein
LSFLSPAEVGDVIAFDFPANAVSDEQAEILADYFCDT